MHFERVLRDELAARGCQVERITVYNVIRQPGFIVIGIETLCAEPTSFVTDRASLVDDRFLKSLAEWVADPDGDLLPTLSAVLALG